MANIYQRPGPRDSEYEEIENQENERAAVENGGNNEPVVHRLHPPTPSDEAQEEESVNQQTEEGSVIFILDFG
ncbi:hypothetical protein [Candidiatus Paracoxiella cheracis]|uniref:hypothetical protein n=1 Tax=Candidiatus Paracoxiella cheracis TaxID=3405120 RepID=UPI003BF4CD77